VTLPKEGASGTYYNYQYDYEDHHNATPSPAIITITSGLFILLRPPPLPAISPPSHIVTYQ